MTACNGWKILGLIGRRTHLYADCKWCSGVSNEMAACEANNMAQAHMRSASGTWMLGETSSAFDIKELNEPNELNKWNDLAKERKAALVIPQEENVQKNKPYQEPIENHVNIKQMYRYKDKRSYTNWTTGTQDKCLTLISKCELNLNVNIWGTTQEISSRSSEPEPTNGVAALKSTLPGLLLPLMTLHHEMELFLLKYLFVWTGSIHEIGIKHLLIVHFQLIIGRAKTAHGAWDALNTCVFLWYYNAH